MDLITLFLCGDVMTGRGIDQILPHPSHPRLFEENIRDARDYVSLAERESGSIARPAETSAIWGDALDELTRVRPDVRIVNLETSVTESSDVWRDKAVHYRMHPSNVSCLVALGADVCVLANNHVMDWGAAGLLETLATLKHAGLATAGAGATRKEAWRPAIVNLEAGRHVVVAGFGHGSSGIPAEWAATEHAPGVALLSDLSEASAELVGDVIGSARKRGGIAVASVHWGSNWGYEVPQQHSRFAHALIDRGVDIVHAHSSHHPRPIELYRGKLILYGCGDFIDDYEGISGHDRFRDDLVLMYFPTVDAGTGELIELRMMPMRIRKMRLERASQLEASWLKELLSSISRPYGTDVVRVGGTELLALG